MVCVLAVLGAWEDASWKALISEVESQEMRIRSLLLFGKTEAAQIFCHFGACSCSLSKDSTFLCRTLGYN